MTTPKAAPSTSAPPRAPDQAEELLLSVTAPAHGGHCVARPVGDPSGRVVFVRHTLPGETVRARVTERTARVWRAEVVDVVEASPDRVRSVWPEAGPFGVGGGELAHVALSAQRTWKRWVLADCLRRLGGPEVVEAVAALPGGTAASTGAGTAGGVPVEPMPSEVRDQASGSARRRALAGTATRTRVTLDVGEDGRPGMHAFRSREVLPLTRLPLAVRSLQELGLLERTRWRRRYQPGTRLRAVAPSLGEPVVVLDEQVLSATARPTGRRRVEEVVDATGLGLGELHYSVRADGFWQVHVDAPAVLVDRVVRAVLEGTAEGAAEGTAEGAAEGTAEGAAGPAGPGAARPDASQRPAPVDARRASGRRVLELYSGSGLFTLPLAMLVGSSGQICTLEGDAQADRDARRNLHGFRSARLATGKVTPAAVAAAATAFDGGGPDVVVLDPPRRGAGRQVAQAVAALGPERIVLVACDPAALSRDLAALLASGFRLGAMSALDMFPHTHHVEVVAVLERR